MNRQIWAIFLVITNVSTSFCQISEDFDSDMLSQMWEGDRNTYIINSDQQLQLKATEAGESSLYTPFILEEEIAWDLSIKMDFNPSNSNNLRVYIYRSDPALESDDALFLKIGETGSADGLHLYERINGSETLIASGREGIFSENPEAQLMISVSADGICSISIISPVFGCIAEDILVSITPLSIGSPVYFGWTCKYTSTRKERFFFDDIFIGPYEEDRTPPELMNTMREMDGFTFEFNEAILSDFSLTTTPKVDLEVNSQKRSITIAGAFLENQEYSFSLQNISDLNGNILDTIITYFISRPPQIGELLINEILFNPIGQGSDFVEIINTSQDILSLSDVMIANLDKEEVHPIRFSQLEPGGILVLTADAQNVVDNYPNHNSNYIIQQEIPTWNNDDGNVAILFKNETIDAFNYDEDMHLVFLDRIDGVSLERVSIHQSSSDLKNWNSASAASGYGTPGLPNSATSEILIENTFTLNSKIISPNGDGDRDILEVSYNLDSPGYVASASIYTDNGQLVDHILRNQSLSTTGSFSWATVNANGFAASNGIHILVMDFFNISGSKFQEKISFAISDSPF